MGIFERLQGRPRPRLTGVSTPYGGMQWEWTASEREILRGLLIRMGGRRVLWEDHCREVTPYVTESILQLRSELTTAMKDLPPRSYALQVLLVMRRACNDYLTAAQGFPNSMTPGLHPSVAGALDELRWCMYEGLAMLQREYELDQPAPDEPLAVEVGRWLDGGEPPKALAAGPPSADQPSWRTHHRKSKKRRRSR
jgi:hypothetical protein